MKKLARYVIFYTFTFIWVLIFSVIFRFFALWIDTVRTVSSIVNPEPITLITIIRMALPETLFLSILFSLSYSARRKIPAPLSIIALFILSGAFSLGFFIGIERIEAMNIPAFSNFRITTDNVQIEPGIILSTRDMDMILLNENTVSPNSSGAVDRTAFSGFPRVISFPERTLMYQETPIGRDTTFFNLPIGNDVPWFFQSIIMDLDMTGRELDFRYKEGIDSFFLHGFSLILLLISLRFLFGLSSWSLANLFYGAIAFRAVLSLEIFLITPETEAVIRSFLGERLQALPIAPLVYLILATLILLYTFLAFLAWRSKEER